MKLVNIFPKQALAPVLTAALSLASIFSPSTGNAEPAARATTISTSAPDRNVSVPAHNRTIPAPTNPSVGGKLADAIGYSTKGVSIVVILGKNDTVDPYYKDLAAVMRVTKREGVPTQIFDMRSLEKEETTGFLIIDGLIFKKPPDEKINYSSNEFLDMGGDAISLFRQSQRYKSEQKAAADSPTVAVR